MCFAGKGLVKSKKAARLMNLHLFEKHPPCNQCNRNLPFPTAEFGGFGHERRTGRAGGARRDALSGQAGLEGLAGKKKNDLEAGQLHAARPAVIGSSRLLA